jgi:Asp-tRNA(Asn)/Glu-tRNA(Gln) amidotransferase A subunit family amidase
MPMASSLDTPGTFTHSVKDAAYLYNLMNGYDPLEGSSLPGKHIVDTSKFDNKDLT